MAAQDVPVVRKGRVEVQTGGRAWLISAGLIDVSTTQRSGNSVISRSAQRKTRNRLARTKRISILQDVGVAPEDVEQLLHDDGEDEQEADAER